MDTSQFFNEKIMSAVRRKFSGTDGDKQSIFIFLHASGILIVNIPVWYADFEEKDAKHECFNPLNTKRRLLYLKTQFVPRSKHIPPRL